MSQNRRHYAAPEARSEKIEVGVYGVYGNFQVPLPDTVIAVCARLPLVTADPNFNGCYENEHGS